MTPRCPNSFLALLEYPIDTNLSIQIPCHLHHHPQISANNSIQCASIIITVLLSSHGSVAQRYSLYAHHASIIAKQDPSHVTHPRHSSLPHPQCSSRPHFSFSIVYAVHPYLVGRTIIIDRGNDRMRIR